MLLWRQTIWLLIQGQKMLSREKVIWILQHLKLVFSIIYFQTLSLIMIFLYLHITYWRNKLILVHFYFITLCTALMMDAWLFYKNYFMYENLGKMRHLTDVYLCKIVLLWIVSQKRTFTSTHCYGGPL